MRETERQKRWAAGSITAYLCLVLILMLSLISGTIASVRNAHARVMTACAMEQGLYSLFAGYDRTLLGQYELFFYNGGDKSGVWKPETMSRKVAETAGEVLSPTASGMGILSGSLSGGQVTEVYLGGYRLATDEEGSAFSRQICEAMKASLGTYGIQQLSQKLRGEQETVKRQEDGQSGYEEEEVLKQYEESKQPEEGTEKTEGEGESGNGTPSEPDQKQPVPEDFVNPIEVIQKVMKMGILGLVLPEGQALSQGETDVSFLASKRELQSGFGMAECGKELSFVDKMLSSEYILWKFPCFTSKEKKEGLQCQVEYVLCGKNSDQDNLAGTVNRLLALREAANLVYLAKDAQKQGEMEAMAGVIAASFGVPGGDAGCENGTCRVLGICRKHSGSAGTAGWWKSSTVQNGRIVAAFSGTASETAGNRGSEQKKCTGRHGVFRLSAAAFDAEIGKSGNVWSDGSGGIQYADRTAAAGFPTGLLCR